MVDVKNSLDSGERRGGREMLQAAGSAVHARQSWVALVRSCCSCWIDFLHITLSVDVLFTALPLVSTHFHQLSNSQHKADAAPTSFHPTSPSRVFRCVCASTISLPPASKTTPLLLIALHPSFFECNLLDTTFNSLSPELTRPSACSVDAGSNLNNSSLRL